jgi:ribosomal protein S18 acetylase RimI-like enzyme
VTVRIERVTSVDDELVAAFELLTPQLSRSSPPPSRAELEEIVADPGNHLLIARDDTDGGRIVGTTTLVTFRIPTGMRAWIEDVIVDSACAGRGISYDINRVALDTARALGCKTVDLTSRPSREAANHVYKKLGFVERETNVYRFSLD